MHYVDKKKIILDGWHVDISSDMPNTYYEACEAMRNGVKSITVDLGKIEVDKVETVFLSLRALARGYGVQLYAKGGLVLAKYNQFVSLYEIDDYTEYAEMVEANKCDLNKLRLIDRDISCTSYMSALVNLPRVEDVIELAEVVICAEMFLICQLNNFIYPKCFFSGAFSTALGINGLHEWLMQRDYPYAINQELEHWIEVYKLSSECLEVIDHIKSNGWLEPNTIRGIFPHSYGGTTRGISILDSIEVVQRLHKRGIRKEELTIQYTIADQMDILDIISTSIDGFIRSEITVEKEDSSSGLIYNCLDTDLKELSLNFL